MITSVESLAPGELMVQWRLSEYLNGDRSRPERRRAQPRGSNPAADTVHVFGGIFHSYAIHGVIWVGVSYQYSRKL